MLGERVEDAGRIAIAVQLPKSSVLWPHVLDNLGNALRSGGTGDCCARRPPGEARWGVACLPATEQEQSLDATSSCAGQPVAMNLMGNAISVPPQRLVKKQNLSDRHDPPVRKIALALTPTDQGSFIVNFFDYNEVCGGPGAIGEEVYYTPRQDSCLCAQSPSDVEVSGSPQDRC